MTQDKIKAVADSLYCNKNITQDDINELNVAFNEIWNTALMAKQARNDDSLYNQALKIKTEVEEGRLSRSADAINIFLAMLNNNKDKRNDVIDRNQLIATFKENLHTMALCYKAVYIGVMGRLFPDKCNFGDLNEVKEVKDRIASFEQYIDDYNGELIDKTLKEYLDSINAPEEIYNESKFYEEKKYKITRNYNGDLVVEVIADGINYYIPNEYDVEGEVEAIYSDSEIKYDSSIIIMGFGAGRHLSKYYDTTGDDNIIICLEPDADIFLKALHIYKLPVMAEKEIRMLLSIDGINEYSMDGIFRAGIPAHKLKDIVIQVIMGYKPIYNDNLYKYLEDIEKLAKVVNIEYNTRAVRGKNIVENVMKNMRYLINKNTIYSGVKVLEGYLDRPVFVIGAGPSLEKNIDELKRAKNKGIIMAADTAVNLLLSKGIYPDLIVTIDAKKRPETFEGYDTNDIPLLCGFESSTIAIKNRRAPIFALSDVKIMDDIYKRYCKPELDFITGGSVATSAISFSILAGFKQIYLLGLDLAMTDNKYYADGIYTNVDINYDTREFMEKEGYYGGTVLTTPDYYTYAEWIEKQNENFKNLNIINCTEGGLKLKDIDNMTAREVIDSIQDLENVDFVQVLYSAKKTFTKEEQENILDEMKDYVSYSYQLDKKLKLMIEDGTELRDKFANNEQVDFTSFFERVNDMDKLNVTDPYHELVAIKVSEEDRNLVNDVFFRKVEEYESDPLKLLDAVIESLKNMQKANLIVGGVIKDEFAN